MAFQEKKEQEGLEKLSRTLSTTQSLIKEINAKLRNIVGANAEAAGFSKRFVDIYGRGRE